MKKSILIILILILCQNIYGQANRIALKVGYPINLTDHWLVGQWEKPLGIDISFDHSKAILLFGGGVNFSKNDLSWPSFVYSDKNTVATLSPYLKVGLNLNNEILSLIPYLDMGYSALVTDLEKYEGEKGGLYSAIGLDCNFSLTNNIQLGLGAMFNVSYFSLELTNNAISPLIDPIVTSDSDDKVKSLTFNLNLAYRF